MLRPPANQLLVRCQAQVLAPLITLDRHNQQVELKLNNFDEPKPNGYYELWFVSGERRISAGSFTSVGQGETRVLLNAPPEASNYHTLLITEEHVGKGPAPGPEVALKGDMP